jgi:hypothetical protein
LLAPVSDTLHAGLSFSDTTAGCVQLAPAFIACACILVTMIAVSGVNVDSVVRVVTVGANALQTCPWAGPGGPAGPATVGIWTITVVAAEAVAPSASVAVTWNVNTPRGKATTTDEPLGNGGTSWASWPGSRVH